MSSHWFKFVRFYLDTAIKLCKVNPAGEEDGFGPSTGSRSGAGRGRELPPWSHLIELFYYYFTIKLLIVQVLQHDYSQLIDEQRVAQTKSATNQSAPPTGNRNENDTRQDQLEAAIARLRLLGNAFYELGYAIESTFILVIVCLYLGYCQPRLYVAKRGLVRLNVLAMLLDPEQERTRVVRRDIARETQNFVASLDNFVDTCRERILQVHSWLAPSHAATRPAKRNCNHRNHTDFQCHLQLLEIDQAREHTARMVSQLALGDHLVPLNRRPEWLWHVTRLYGYLVAFFQLLGISTILMIIVLFPRLGLIRDFKLYNEPADVLFQIELICYNLLGLQWLSFYLVALVMNAYDQIEFVRQLDSMVTNLIGDIRGTSPSPQVMFEATHQPLPPPPLLSERLTRVLILYKQFVSQLRTTRHFVGFVASQFILVMLCPPIIERIYAAYLTRQVRCINLVRTLVVTLSCDALLLPHCWLHARSLDLYTRMSRLLAHLDARQLATGKANRVEQVVDEHAVWLLRRELNSPELATARFATRALFLRLTYADLIGIHFWCGFLLAPSFMRETAHLGANSSHILKIF